LAGRDIGLMIFPRESFGKFSHIPKNGLVGHWRYYGSHARHFRSLLKDGARQNRPLLLLNGAVPLGLGCHYSLSSICMGSRSL